MTINKLNAPEIHCDQWQWLYARSAKLGVDLRCTSKEDTRAAKRWYDLDPLLHDAWGGDDDASLAILIGGGKYCQLLGDNEKSFNDQFASREYVWRFGEDLMDAAHDAVKVESATAKERVCKKPNANVKRRQRAKHVGVRLNNQLGARDLICVAASMAKLPFFASCCICGISLMHQVVPVPGGNS